VSLILRTARTDRTTPVDTSGARTSVPGFVSLIRRNIVQGEYHAALAELAKATPCDGCAMFERCKAEKLACRAFFAYVHRDREGPRVNWPKLQRKPSRALYDAVMSADAPDTVATAGGHIWALVDLETELRGKRIGERMVLAVGARRNHRRHQVATVTLHCGRCDRIKTVDLSRAQRPDCLCVCRSVATPEAREAAQERERATRIAMERSSAAADARAKADYERQRAQVQVQACAP